MAPSFSTRCRTCRVGRQRMEGGRARLLDLLLAFSDGGCPPELWELARRQPPRVWPQRAQVAHRMHEHHLARLRARCQGVPCAAGKGERARRGRASGGPACRQSLAAPAHSGAMLHPVRAAGCGRSAWRGTPPAKSPASSAVPIGNDPPPPQFDSMHRVEVVRLAPWLPMVPITDPKGRLEGDEGMPTPWSLATMQTSAPSQRACTWLAGGSELPPRVKLTCSATTKDIDGSSLVLPWRFAKEPRSRPSKRSMGQHALAVLPQLRAQRLL